MNSNLRLGILYILALSGVITVLTTAAMIDPDPARAAAWHSNGCRPRS